MKSNNKTGIEKFKFEEQQLYTPQLEETRILASTNCPEDSQSIFILTDKSELIRININTSESNIIANLLNLDLPLSAEFHLYCNDSARYFAVTWRQCRSYEQAAICKGTVIDAENGNNILTLSAGDYHTEQTPLPVCFLKHQNKTLLVHATDWNRLDITDLETGEIITQRDLDEDLEECDEDDDWVFKEWSGVLKPSPNQTRLATIGWIWHPVGVALSYDLKAWLNGSLWETDKSPNMRSYAIWDYFWDSPFFWIDEQKLCIWGAGDGESTDEPANKAAIFDAESEELLLSISGPTDDIFFCDTYLFSGLHNKEQKPIGLTIWSLEDGALLCKKEGIFADLYIPEERALIAFGEQGKITINRWSL
ncbi:hypothetical protein ACJJIK_10410 [Microbulbifer sp. ZKSA006]|uniref:hypothetical protein n=1 Tax=Microbulbifer sp. ZKSA006 TaxID=3243390 RepID=UPI004039A196